MKSPKSLISALFLTAAMSIIVAQSFSNFAVAGDLITTVPSASDITGPSLAGDARFLGIFEVKSINSEKGKVVGDLCKSETASARGIDPRCSQEVWAYSKENQLILVKPPTQNDIDNDRFALFSLDGDCKTQGSLKEAAQNGIFSLSLCAATGAPGSKILGGTIGLVSGSQSLETLATSGALVLPGTVTQGEIKLADNKISIHEHSKSRIAWIFPVTTTDDTIVLEPK